MSWVGVGAPDEKREKDKESWRAGRQRGWTRRAIREHGEGGRKEVKREGSEEEARSSRENKRMKKEKKKIKNNERVTGCCLIMWCRQQKQSELPLGLTHFQKKTPPVINNACSTRGEKKNEANAINRTHQNRAQRLSFVFYLPASARLPTLTLDITHASSSVRQRRGVPMRHRSETDQCQKLDTVSKPEGFRKKMEDEQVAEDMSNEPCSPVIYSSLPLTTAHSWKCIWTHLDRQRDCRARGLHPHCL